MPGKHSKLGPSSAHRWLTCPASMRLCELPEFRKETTSEAAEEGTLAHGYAEQKLIKWLEKKRNKIICLDIQGDMDKDMDAYTDAYRDYVVEQFNKAKRTDPTAKLLVEEELHYETWVAGGWGTSDAVIIADGTCHVIDLKYGKGVPVDAEDNVQCMLYALGAVNTYDLVYEFDKVCTHIYQPRKDYIGTETHSVESLIKWGETVVKPVAELIGKGEGNYNPGEHQCQWCPARATCKARAAHQLGLAERYQMLEADLLDQEEILDILKRGKALSGWVTDVTDHALAQMLTGTQYEGFKVVEGTARRVISDKVELEKRLHDHDYADEKIKDLLGLGALEKLIGKKEFTVLSDGCLMKPQGKPTIAPITDKRPPFRSMQAKEAFKDIESTEECKGENNNGSK